MATSSKVQLSSTQEPRFFIPGVSSESAETATYLLQKNHEQTHIYFNDDGFHNHIVHHLLTLLALKASPDEIEKGYKENATYQRPLGPLEESVVKDMHDVNKFQSYLGKQKYYHDFLVFFQQEMDKKGWEAVLNEYLFAGDERADDMLVRLYAGFLHPVIHLGFGVEFKQPAIIAEALAQTAIHDNWIGALFLGAEKEIQEQAGGSAPKKPIVQLLEEIRDDKELSSAAHLDDGNKVRGILKRAPKQMIKYASQYRVDEKDLEKKTAEMINAAAYFTGAAQRPPHQVKFDFFYMHCINSSIFFSSLLEQSWLSPANKVRLLEWKVRADLALYASRGCPKLLIDEITTYKPKHGVDASWEDVFQRVRAHSDDGHASKFVRALAHGEKACRPWEGEEGFPIKGDMWRLLGHMVIDSVEGAGEHWVRNAGFEEAWKDIPLREGAKL